MNTLIDFNESATDLSAPVDVLAIMDRAADSADYAPATDEMVHAIDAVRELIEAAAVFEAQDRADGHLGSARLRVALARCKGGSNG